MAENKGMYRTITREEKFVIVDPQMAQDSCKKEKDESGLNLKVF